MDRKVIQEFKEKKVSGGNCFTEAPSLEDYVTSRVAWLFGSHLVVRLFKNFSIHDQIQEMEGGKDTTSLSH